MTWLTTSIHQGVGPPGAIYAAARLSNSRDETLAKSGLVGHSRIRTVTINRVLLDDTVTSLSLPESLIAELGLTFKHAISASTPVGFIRTHLYSDAGLAIGERTAVVECLAIPDSALPVLGFIPMAMLGLKPDRLTGRLRFLQDREYLRI